MASVFSSFPVTNIVGIHVKFMQHKSHTLQNFKEYLAENDTPSVLRPDNDNEYTKKFQTVLYQQQNQAKYIVPESPEQKSVAERCNRTVV